MRDLSRELGAGAAAAGFDVRITSAAHLADLHRELNARIESGEVDRTFAKERLGHFDFSPVINGAPPASIIITAVPQPEQLAVFHYIGKEHRYLIPPTYTWDTDARVESVLSDLTAPAGFGLYQAIIPLKLTAVRTGLARYGRNNIAYHARFGSYFRLKAFLSDMPAETDDWTEETWLPECAACAACAAACPTKAVTGDRDLIRAERCLTYFNERTSDYPTWVDPSWFKCLIGCMFCQLACPVDRDRDISPRETFRFDEDETAGLLEAGEEPDLPATVRDKLTALWLLEDWNIIARNLRELLNAEMHRNAR